MSDDIHERVALDVTRMAAPLIGEQWFDTEKFVHDELTEKIAEILRREYGDQFAAKVADKVIFKFKDQLKQTEIKLEKTRKTLHWYGHECSAHEYRGEYGQRAREVLKETDG